MMIRAACVLFACAATLASSLLLRKPDPFAQSTSKPAAELSASGVGLVARTFTAADWKTLPRVTVSVPAEQEKVVRYEGVRVADVLRAAGMKFGHDLRGPRLADCLVAEARDGYRVVFALPEL